MGSGGKGGSGTAPGAGKLSKLATQLFNETTPMRQQLGQQMMEALTTGGVGARIPMIQRAVESSKAATSQALQGTNKQLAQTGTAGTPFASGILSNILGQGELQTANIPTAIANEFIQMVPNFSLGSAQSGLQGLSSAVSANATTTASKNQAAAQELGAWLSFASEMTNAGHYTGKG